VKIDIGIAMALRQDKGRKERGKEEKKGEKKEKKKESKFGWLDLFRT
jgi:hypothetical protein